VLEWSVCVSGQYVVSVMFVVVCRWQCPLCYTAVGVGVVGVAAFIAVTVYKSYRQ